MVIIWQMDDDGEEEIRLIDLQLALPQVKTHGVSVSFRTPQQLGTALTSMQIRVQACSWHTCDISPVEYVCLGPQADAMP